LYKKNLSSVTDLGRIRNAKNSHKSYKTLLLLKAYKLYRNFYKNQFISLEKMQKTEKKSRISKWPYPLRSATMAAYDSCISCN